MKINYKKNIAIFLEFVEIQTKIASVFPMLIGFFWSAYYYNSFNFINGMLFFFGAIFFDMATTAINNAMDYHSALDEEYKYGTNVIGRYQLSFRKMVGIILVLLTISLFFNLILVWRTDIMLLFIGVLFYLIGITYTFGPLPTSRTPLGEVLSGMTMGFGIFFLAVFMSQYDTLLSSEWTDQSVQVTFGWLETLRIYIMSLPLVALISNIMLANNLRDEKMDIRNGRKTLVSYIGHERGVLLYQVLSFVPWCVWILLIITNHLPFWTLIGFSGLILHVPSIKRFTVKMKASETYPAAFPEAIKSFVLFSMIYLSMMVILVIFA